MPKPVFIICSESGTVDRFTNLVSIHNVIEHLTCHAGESGEKKDGAPGGLGISKMRATAQWSKSEGDDSRAFFHEFTISMFGSPPKVISASAFAFRTPFHRFVVDLILPSSTELEDAESNIVFTSRIRAKGEEEWISQSYTIPVEYVGFTSGDRSSPESAQN